MSQRLELVGVGANANIEHQVDPSFQAGRMSIKPYEFVNQGLIGGHFTMVASFNNTAGQPSGTSSSLFSMRWVDTRTLFLLNRVQMWCTLVTNAAAVQAIDFDIIKATSYSASPSGGTQITLATTSNKARSNTMSGSLLSTSGDLRISSGAALTPGTLTVDTQPFGYASFLPTSVASTAAQGAGQPLYENRDTGQHPFIFSGNEGFVIRNGVAFPATMVVKLAIQINWAEVSFY